MRARKISLSTLDPPNGDDIQTWIPEQQSSSRRPSRILGGSKSCGTQSTTSCAIVRSPAYSTGLAKQHLQLGGADTPLRSTSTLVHSGKPSLARSPHPMERGSRPLLPSKWTIPAWCGLPGYESKTHHLPHPGFHSDMEDRDHSRRPCSPQQREHQAPSPIHCQVAVRDTCERAFVGLWVMERTMGWRN